MVNWNEVVHDYLWVSGVIINFLLALSILGFAGYGIYQVVITHL